MRISARADYAVRAATALARLSADERASSESIAAKEAIPASFLEAILGDLRRSGLVESKRGAAGGFRLAAEPKNITVADVIRAVEGPLVYVRDTRPSELTYAGEESGGTFVELWVALRANVRAVLERTTLADLAAGRLPAHVRALADDPSSWRQSTALGD
ncbi:Rrf2 family transcriptional regulator [Microbacterium paludicola]|uniref:Rrf2 family transcriptional regulator n=1 Tax=Microbacterium paludicola TaxID=300019 RepID=A0A4Y9FT45_9MICO|nr:Rrf2 family transcriptional regulator [Microbacterium paludicola]MBF0817337.1 Rrf2 family transcriptional regulator [Microbacterium paludicola]TFU31710.1 Rrf2 family transcriptional regulator [Microbacterium paludicola]